LGKDHKLSVGELEDELKVKERRIEELRVMIGFSGLQTT
jgi:hypothetical protein